MVSLTWKTPSTPIEFRGEGDTEADAWIDLHKAIFTYQDQVVAELQALSIEALVRAGEP